MNEAPTIAEYTQFFQGLNSIETQFTDFRIRRDRDGLAQLFSGMAVLLPLKEQYLRTQASNYNLFDILNIRHYETKVHTPFLVNLLNPKGSHQQGIFFYQSFVQRVLPEKDHPVFANPTWLQVTEEKFVGALGRIDIFIGGYFRGNPFALIIENKLYASDQNEQVKRYYHYAKKILGLKDDQIRILYLTIDGSAPTPNSISPKKWGKLQRKGVAFAISYRNDIREWLEAALPQVQAPVVKETLVQYLRTLKTL